MHVSVTQLSLISIRDVTCYFFSALEDGENLSWLPYGCSHCPGLWNKVQAIDAFTIRLHESNMTKKSLLRARPKPEHLLGSVLLASQCVGGYVYYASLK
jgi:hypothetical protein